MKTFEELPVWRKARELTRNVYNATRNVRDPGFCDQIQRAALSITSNIAEGHERGTTPDLIQFLFYAKGSAGEVRCQLYLAEDLGYLKSDAAEALREECRAVGRQLSAWIQSMQTLNFNAGPAYHKEPDRSLERMAARFGYARQKDGSYRQVREPSAAYGDGKRKTGKRK